MSQNLNLQWLTCGGNQLNNLDVTQNFNLINLWCDNNELSGLDVSQNLNLKSLWCWNNPLGSIDISQNLNLESFDCSNTEISTLDVSHNINLRGLGCSNNQLSVLDLTSNINLQELDCADNQLTSLFIDNGNNQNLSTMISTGNPDLACIQVDDESATRPECEGLPTTGWCKDEWSSYSEDCSLGLTDLESINFSLYPNPVKNQLFLSSKNIAENLTLKIFDIEGKLLSFQNLEFENQVSVDVSNLSNGIYFLSIEDERGNMANKKFLKE